MNLKFRHTSILLLIFGISIRLFNVFYIPKYMAPDEEPHFKYIKYLFQHHQLPLIVSKTGAETNDWEYYQPPLYYLLNSPLLLFGEDIGFYFCRIFSVILFLITFYFLQKVLKNLNFSNFRKNIITTIFCLLPTYVFLSSVVNNDNLLVFFSILALYILTLRNWKGNTVILGLIVGLAFLTKLSAIIILMTILLYFYFLEKDVFVIKSLAVIMFGLLVASPIYYRNWLLYGSFTSENTVNLSWTWISIQDFINLVLIKPMYSFWSVAGKANDLRSFIYIFCYPFFFISFTSFSLIKKLMKIEKLYLVSFCIIICNIALVLYAGFMYNQAQGRFLLPSLFFISYFYVIGLEFYIKKIKFLNKKLLCYGFLLLLVFTNIGLYMKFEKLKKEKDSPTRIEEKIKSREIF